MSINSKIVDGLRALAPRQRLDPVVAALLEAWQLMGPAPPGCSPRQRAAASGHAALQNLVELHELVAYAGRPSTSAEHRRARDLLAEFKRQLKASSGCSA